MPEIATLKHFFNIDYLLKVHKGLNTFQLKIQCGFQLFYTKYI